MCVIDPGHRSRIIAWPSGVNASASINSAPSVERPTYAAAMHAKQWLAAYAQRLGTEPPTPAELKAILDLAAEAAHASERIAAPVACWLSARAGKSLEESLRLAKATSSSA
jgi:Domain of unknown function (DUF6457)